MMQERIAADMRRTVKLMRLALLLWLVTGLMLVLARPAHGQEPPAPAPSPSPAAPLWALDIDTGASDISVPNNGVKAYATGRLTVHGEPWQRVQLFGRGSLNRTSDGSAVSIADFDSFASIEAIAGARYRIRNTPVSVGGIGAVTWSRESDIRSPSDPRLWTVEGIVCVERFAWWPSGGLACIGAGHRGPVGGAAVSVSVMQPIKGDVFVTVDFDVPFQKLPEVARTLPNALPAVAPTAEDLKRFGERLPVAVTVGVLVRLKRLHF